MRNYILDKIAKFQFWRAKNIKIDEHYTLIFDVSSPKGIAFKILKKYPNVVVEISDTRLEDDHNFSFDMTVLDNPDGYDVESKKFKNFVSDVFRNIIVESIKNFEAMNENGKFDSFEPAEERELHEEVTSILEERVPERKPRKKAIRGNKKVHS